MALYKQPDPSQYRFVTLNFAELFPQEHPTNQLLELIRSLDLSKFDSGYKNGTQDGGRSAMPVDRMLALIVYSLLYGNLSMRRLSRDMTVRADLMFLSGGFEIDHSTFSVFRSRHEKALLNLFTQTVFLGVRSGFIDLDTVCIDSTKIKACANSEDIGTQEQLEKMFSYAEKTCRKRFEEWQNASETDQQYKEKKHKDAVRRKAKIEEGLSFLKERQDRVRVHIYDHDAEIQKSNGRFLIGYNVQQAVDYNSRMIVHQEVHTKQGDSEFTAPMVNGIEELKKDLPFESVPGSKYLLDSGYASEENLKKLDGLNIYMPDARFARDIGLGGKIRPEDRIRPESLQKEPDAESVMKDFNNIFIYNKYKDEFTCPAGEKLLQKKTRKLGNQVYIVFRKSGCSSCKYRIPCIGNRGTRKDIMVSETNLADGLNYSPRRQPRREREYTEPSKTELMRKKLKLPENRLIYARRMMIEGVFGTMKAVRKGREFFRRGLKRVSVEHSERGLAHNLARILVLRGLQGVNV